MTEGEDSAERSWRRPMTARVVNGVVLAVGAAAVTAVFGSLAASPSASASTSASAGFAVISGLAVVLAGALSVINARGLRSGDQVTRSSLGRAAGLVALAAGVLLLVVIVIVVGAWSTDTSSNTLAMGVLAMGLPVFVLALAVLTGSALRRLRPAGSTS